MDDNVAMTCTSIACSWKPVKEQQLQVCRLHRRSLRLPSLSTRSSMSNPTFTQTLSIIYIEEDPPMKPPVKRTPKAEMDASNSLSADFLEDWVHPTFDKVLMPTVLDHYGGQEDPWTVDLETALHGWRVKDMVHVDSPSMCCG